MVCKAVLLVINGLMRFKTPMAEACFFHNLSICTEQVRCSSICTPKDFTKLTLLISFPLTLVLIDPLPIKQTFEFKKLLAQLERISLI